MQNKKFIILLVVVAGCAFKSLQAQSTDAILAYIARYKDLAIAEMQRSGIPAAITLAQGIHETEAGNSELVRKSNNHFGIKCKDSWTGLSVSHDDDAKGECFRKYSAPEDSYKDHSDFLRTRPNYASLFTIDPTDYEAWAYGLKKAGYATNPRYPQILIKLIEDYHLQDFTLIALGKLPGENYYVKSDKLPTDKKNEVLLVSDNKGLKEGRVAQVNEEPTLLVTAAPPKIDYPSGEFKINETRVLYVKQGTSYLTIAQQYELPLAKLFEFNDLKSGQIAEEDQLVFIQRKRKTGDHEFHVVQPGETMNSIAQTEALRLESLFEYNNLGTGMQPAVGETLYLRDKSPSAPKLAKKYASFNPGPSSQTGAMNTSGNEERPVVNRKSFMVHPVQARETVYSIAKKYNVSAEDIINWNQLRDNDLRIGQSLKIYK